MSRKWERMVLKNTKTANKIRAKQGKPLLSEARSDRGFRIKGRNWVLPLLLFCVGLFCFIAFRGTNQDETLYWITGFSYIALGLFTYAARRPFLDIGKTFLMTRRFTGNRRAEAENIQDIAVAKDSVVITLKGKGEKWVFTRMFHRIDISLMAERLKEFADQNGVSYRAE